MPAKSEKQANLFRAALGDPKPGTTAAKIKATVPREKIKHFTKVGEEVEEKLEGTAETLGMTSEGLKEEIRKIIKEVLFEDSTRNPKHPKTGEVLNFPSDIPNRVGFRLIAVYKDGTELKTIVQKRENGMHHLTGVTDWSKMLGWKKII